MSSELIQTLSDELYGAVANQAPIAPLAARHPELGIEDAYAISLAVLGRRQAAGETLIGKKIGLTTQAVRDMLGIDEPDFGFLTDRMRVANGSTIHPATGLLPPMMESEIAFVLRDDLPTSGVTNADVLAATDYVAPCLEIVGTRFNTQKISIVDTVADNASADRFVLGDARADPRALDLAAVRCVTTRNGEVVSEGVGEAVMGTPLAAVAWLANRIGSFGVSLTAGDIVLAGSLVALTPAAPGDVYVAEFDGLGSVEARFAASPST